MKRCSYCIVGLSILAFGCSGDGNLGSTIEQTKDRKVSETIIEPPRYKEAPSFIVEGLAIGLEQGMSFHPKGYIL